ncbi:thiamine phosphate synthase [Sphingobacterium multivorum]|jgi:thiamine-phosphate pyrophosphorylase|uniref:thiamine phosphate synthase n=1 Tax=Sphingobacterium multivorum TaxID=28454 RepID=UPI00289EF821|nr:thiamine phosphate synthase [Sphingobacterium multivorum]
MQTKTMERLQYISQGKTLREQKNNMLKALDAGAKWIQIRWKEAEEKDLYALAEEIRQACSEFGASCIINDHPSLAAAVDADGVHLGLDDCSVAAARHLLGAGKIIGGTANSFANVKQRISEHCDYIGLGPFNYTTTKQKLSPLLGIAGYENIIQQVRREGLPPIPIFAIGGISQLEDIQHLLEIGVYGVALSGIVTKTPNIVSSINKILL